MHTRSSTSGFIEIKMWFQEFIDVKCGDSWTNLTSIELSVLNEIAMAELKETQKKMLVVKAVAK